MDTWWIDEPYLLGSRNPTNADLKQLRDDGFTVLISLLIEDKQPPNYDVANVVELGFTIHNIPVADFCPPSIEQLDQFVKLIERLSPGNKTIIHCEGGTGRTGTFAAAYWISKGMSVADAIRYVRKQRKDAVETTEQEMILTEYSSRIRH